MTSTKRILIETECHEVFVLRVNGKSQVRGFCAGCKADTELLTLDEAVSSSGIGTLDILDRVRDGRVHFCETANGHLLVCRASLNALSQKGVNDGQQD